MHDGFTKFDPEEAVRHILRLRGGPVSLAFYVEDRNGQIVVTSDKPKGATGDLKIVRFMNGLIKFKAPLSPMTMSLYRRWIKGWQEAGFTVEINEVKTPQHGRA